MQTHAKTRMDILIEAPFRARLAHLLDQHEVSGYTIFPALGGRGEEGGWTRAGQITEMGQMLLFTCILDGGRADDLLEDLAAQMAAHIGYVTTFEVNVFRPAKFP